MRLWMSAFVVALAFSMSARAEEGVITGNEVLDACVATDPSMGGFRSGYIIGLLEGVKWGAYIVYMLVADEGDTKEVANSFIENAMSPCLPGNVEYGRVQDVFSKYLLEHPDTRHESARSLFTTALTEDFSVPEVDSLTNAPRILILWA